MLSQMCRSPACLDAPWAPANSRLLLVAAALQRGCRGLAVLSAAVLLLFGCLSASFPLLQPWSFQMLICTEIRLGGLEELVTSVWLFAFRWNPLGESARG